MTKSERVWETLSGVMDPEIPTCSIVDLGMVERVEANDGSIEVDLLPTFLGCPAKELIGRDVEAAVRTVADGDDVRVRFLYEPAWTTERITERGKAALRAMGISPHWDGGGATVVPLMTGSSVPCPYCGSAETVTESAFGPTPCRTIHFCRACRNPFEGFKEKAAGSARSQLVSGPP